MLTHFASEMSTCTERLNKDNGGGSKAGEDWQQGITLETATSSEIYRHAESTLFKSFQEHMSFPIVGDAEADDPGHNDQRLGSGPLCLTLA